MTCLTALAALTLGRVAAAAEPPTPESSVVVVTRPSAPPPKEEPAPPPRRAESRAEAPATRAAQALVRAPAPAPAPALAAPAPRPDVSAQALSKAPSAPKVLPWVSLGLSAAAGVAGAVFMSRSISALNEEVEVEVKNSGNGVSTVEISEAFREQQTRVLTNGIAGTVLLSTAVAGTVASLISLLSE